MTDLQRQWIRTVEEYYRDRYPAPMAKKVVEILPKTKDVLQQLYDVVINSVEAKYRTVPDVVAIERAMREVDEVRMYTASSQLRIDDKGAVPRDKATEFMSLLGKSIAEGRDPRKDQRIIDAINELSTTQT